MNTAQPALLYLCPMLIFVSYITALIRKETRAFFTGQPVSNRTSSKLRKKLDYKGFHFKKQISELVKASESQKGPSLYTTQNSVTPKNETTDGDSPIQS